MARRLERNATARAKDTLLIKSKLIVTLYWQVHRGHCVVRNKSLYVLPLFADEDEALLQAASSSSIDITSALRLIARGLHVWMNRQTCDIKPPLNMKQINNIFSPSPVPSHSFSHSFLSQSLSRLSLAGTHFYLRRKWKLFWVYKQ